MTATKTSKQYEKELFEKELDFVNLEPYVTAKTKILHECFNGHQWLVSPTSILMGYGCPYCAGNRQYTTEEYQKQVSFKVLEPYRKTHTPILHGCSKGHQWKASPANIKAGTDCPTCSKSGIDYSQPTTLYFISFIFEGQTLYKIGITNKTIESRFVRERNKLQVKVVWSIRYSNGREALAEEQEILKDNKEFLEPTVEAFQRGNSEILNKQIKKPAG